MKQAMRGVVLAAAALALAAAAPKTVGWIHTTALQPDGAHLIGNPDAQLKVTEYLSYTCPDCARFMIQSDGALQIGYVASGKVAVEIRPLVQGPVDQVAAMLANCGPADKFLLNHSALMRSQPRWSETLARAGAAQKQRWTTGTLLERGRAVADDMNFYEIMASRGYQRRDVDACLGDAALANRIGEASKSAYAAGITAAPSFSLNGTLLDTHDWAGLRTAIDASLKP